MSAYEQPFSHFEERYFLAEILKRSNLPPDLLFAIIRDHRVEPAWTDIALPHGRSVSACQQAYSSIATRTTLPPPPPPPTSQPSPIGSAEFPRGAKRPYSSLGDANTGLPAARELQPRPPGYPGMNGQQLVFPQPAPMAPVAPQRKKRGRPTKAEWERRAAEAQERGEIWPKPRKARARPSTETGESSSSVGAAPLASHRNLPAEAPGSGAAAHTPSPDASRSVSGGPVQPPAGSRGPEAPVSTPPGPPSAGAMEGVQQYAQGTSPSQQPTPQGQQSGEPPHSASSASQSSPKDPQPSAEPPQEQRGRPRS